MLMEHFLQRYFRRRGEDVPPVSDAVKQGFMRYSWPGNVRELENACERIAQTCIVRNRARRLHVGERAVSCRVRAGACAAAALRRRIPNRWRSPLCPRPSAGRSAPPRPWPRLLSPAPRVRRSARAAVAGEVPISLDDRLMEVEASLITWALKASGGNKSKAAELAAHQAVDARRSDQPLRPWPRRTTEVAV